jgi:hypothetical protein
MTIMPSVASSTRTAYSNLSSPFSAADDIDRISAKADPPSTSTFMNWAKPSLMKPPLNSVPWAGQSSDTAMTAVSNSTASQATKFARSFGKITPISSSAMAPAASLSSGQTGISAERLMDCMGIS